jgi:hypothetical protein
MRPSLGTLAAVSVAVAAVLWLPPVVEQLTNRPGNLRSLLDFFVHGRPGGTPLGAARSARVLARELVGLAPWMGAEEPAFMNAVVPRAAGWLLIPVLAVGSVAVLARRRGAIDAQRGVVTAGLAAAIAWVVLARILGPPYTYLVHWTWAIALFLNVTVTWGLARALAPAAGRVAPRVAGAAGWAVVAAMVVSSVLTVIRDRGAELSGDAYARSMQAVAPPVLAWLREHGAGSVLLAPDWPGPVYAGLVAALDRSGIEVGVPDRLTEFPQHRHAAGRTFDARLVVGSGVSIERWSARAGATPIASYQPTTEVERRWSVRPVAVFALAPDARLPSPMGGEPLDGADAPDASATPANAP